MTALTNILESFKYSMNFLMKNNRQVSKHGNKDL